MRSERYKDDDGSSVEIDCEYIDDTVFFRLRDDDWRSGQVSCSRDDLGQVEDGTSFRQYSFSSGYEPIPDENFLEAAHRKDGIKLICRRRSALLGQKDLKNLGELMDEYGKLIQQARTGEHT